MARGFNGTTSKAQGTVTAADTGDWTIAAWVNPTNAGQLNSGNILNTENTGSARQQFGFKGDGTLKLEAIQTYTSGGLTVASTALGSAVWSVVFATFTASDAKLRIYIGTLSSAVAEASYSSQSAGSGTRSTGGTTAVVGNNSAQQITWNGSLGDVLFTARLLRLDEMEAFRLGWRPPKDGSERGFWPLDSPTSTQVEDFYGSANLTATSLTVTENPPVPIWQTGEYAVLVQAGAPTVVPVGQASETDGAQSVTPQRAYLIGQALETDSAQSMTHARGYSVGQASETDTALAVTPKRVVLVGRAAETDRAIPLRPFPPAVFLPPGITRPGRGPLPRKR